jgi:ankyrin repeat protein
MIVKNIFLVTAFLLLYMSDAAAFAEDAKSDDAKSKLIVHMKEHKQWYYQNMGQEFKAVDDRIFRMHLANIISVAVRKDDRVGAGLLLSLPEDILTFMRSENFFMRQAAYFGKIEIAQMLYDKGFSVDETSDRVDSPLDNAVNNSQDKMVDWLIAKGADVHGLRRRYHILSRAICSTDCIFDALLLAGASLDDPRLKGSLLHKAMEIDNYRKINVLLAHGYDPNARDEHGCTPLLLAVQNQQSIETIDLLLHAGANPHVSSHDGLRPMHEAARLNNVELFEHLLVCEVNVGC